MDIFVKRPVLAIVLSLTFLLIGGAAALKIPVLQFPKIESTSLVITTAYPGSSAEVVQGFITDPIERVGMTVPGVDYVDSQTRAGLSTVTLWLKLNEDSTSALAELTTRIDQIAYELPSAALDPSIEVVRTDRPAALFYLNVMDSPLSRPELTDFLQRRINPLLAGIPGVQRIGLEGARSPAMRVWLDPHRMNALQLTTTDVLAVLRNNNVIAAVGKTENDRQRLNLTSNATLKTANDFRQLIISRANGASIRLGDIARVELGEDRGIIQARFNQDSTIYISVWPLPGANEIEIGDELYKKLEQVNKTLPGEMYIEAGFDGTLYMRDALREIFITLMETITLVGIVVLALMGSLRTALVPLVAIPISILGSIAAMAMMGFTLNLLTVLAVVLSVGLVVDDAIVVVENVARHMRDGQGRLQSAINSSRELLQPIVAMTFTLAAVYAPIGFVSGLTGHLFKEFAFTLSVAVVISGIVAITLSPIMSAYVCAEKGRESKATQRVNAIFDRLRARYGRFLHASFGVRNQILVIGLFLSLLTAPFYMFSLKELAPTEDQSEVNIVVEAPPASSLDYAVGYMHDVIDLVYEKVPTLQAVWQIVTPNGGFGGLVLAELDEREESVHTMLPKIFGELSAISGLNVFPVLSPALPSAGRFDVEMVVQSTDSYAEMAEYANKLLLAAKASGMYMFIENDLKIHLPGVRYHFDRDKLADLGLDLASVSQQLAAMLSEGEISRFDADGKAYRVITMLEPEARSKPEAILDLQVRNQNGDLLPLRAFTHYELQTTPRVLAKFNQQRSFRIYGAMLPGKTNGQGLDHLEQLAAEILPADYSIDYAGISRQLRKESNSMMTVLMAAMAVVYLALSIQFNSFRLPLVVLLGSVPLALSGAMMFSFLSLTTVNMYAQIGFVTLVGLVAKNGILITEFAKELQLKGVAKIDAITEAAQIRLRPVLMTTAATVLGHFPLVLVSGPGAEARNSIGIILVAGMAIGTLFTLLVLPSVYHLLASETEETDEAELLGATG
jgi:multidrug efflux pump